MRRRLLTLALLVLLPATGVAQDDGLRIELTNDVALDFVLVPAGTFLQGSPEDEPDRSKDETQREVRLSRGFFLGKYPVTRRQFEQFVQETKYRTEAETGTSGGFGFDGKELVQRREFNWRTPGFEQTADHPVTGVTFRDAEEFLKWLSHRTGRRCELPSEAQWEYACRAGTQTPYYNGSSRDAATEIGWSRSNAGRGTQPVGQKRPNAFGLFDMAGNVWEWCRDWYGPYDSGPVTDPVETRSNRSDKPRRVLRGGSWLKDARNGRSAARFRSDPGSRNADIGFRVLIWNDPVRAAGQTPGQIPTQVEGDDSAGPTGSAPARPTDVQPAVPAPQQESLPGHGGGDPGFRPNSPGSSGMPRWLMLLACAGFIPIVGIAVALLAFKVLSSSTAGRSTPRGSQPPRSELLGEAAGAQRGRRIRGDVRLGNDGFWFTTPGAEIGALVHLTYRIDNRPHSTQVTYQPEGRGQFVYTGGTPRDVEIVGIQPADMRPDNLGRVLLDDPDPFDQDPTPPRRPAPPAVDPTPFRGYPSAY